MLSGSTLEPEWSFLLAACSSETTGKKTERAWPHDRLRWELLFSVAERHGVLPLLFEALQQEPDIVPVEWMQSLKLSYQANLHKSFLLSRELIRITQHLSDHNIESLPYKGLALAELLYGDIALRQAGDIDLLLRPEDLPRAVSALAAIDYVQHSGFSAAEQKAYRKSGYEYAFDGPAGRNILEVQWAFQPRFYAVEFDLDAVFERAIGITVAGHRMRTPSLEDHLLTLSVHAAKHMWGRLIWLCDIARLAARPDLDWNWTLPQARELGVTRILAVSLMLANQLLGTAIPAPAQASLARDRSVKTIGAEIRSSIGSGHSFDVESFAYFRLMGQLRERKADRLRFFSRLALTPGPSEWQSIRLPTVLFPLYRLVRISRLARRVLRT
ncbi:MAG TPA: nucleotidyltransferase family protein [Candidatus Sulfotelmatobacter sp.]|nr:nucleotidyltransferase family protein [Candidatus Sulfotelmatobacter sp.]